MSSWESSSRRRSVASTSRLRMDAYGSSRRSSRAASPPKRRELDTVMKKARREGGSQSNYWNKKLLEAEEKDPNRWRHSGFKELYVSGGNSSHGSHSSRRRTRSRSRSRSRTRRRSRVRSPPLPSRQRSRSRERERERERDRDRDRERERERERERDRDKDRERRPHTPPSQSRQQSVQSRRGTSRRSPPLGSLSASSRSLSSCSDESCSVCSPKANRKRPVMSPVRARQTPRSRSRSFSVPRNRPVTRSPLPAVRPKRRERSGPPSDPRMPPSSPPPATRKLKSKRKEDREKGSKKRKSSRIKGERTKRRRSIPLVEGSPVRRHSSPPVSCSEESSTSSVTSGGGAPKLTLSERFGKMAQWSVDRRDLDGVRNMRITKDSDSSDLKVVIEGDRYRALSPMPVSDRRVGLHYYPETMHAAPVGLDAWDDVRVRYKYYKDRGYLRDLSLDDYIKWEEWWYKYQEWLETERYYEHWAALRAGQTTRSGKGWESGGSRKRRR